MDRNALLITIAAFAATVPTSLCLLARRRAPIERGRKPLYDRVCSRAQFGREHFFGVWIPAVRLAVYEDFIVVCFVRPRVIPLARFEPRKVLGWVHYVYVETQAGQAWWFMQDETEDAVAIVEERMAATAGPRKAAPR